MVHGDDFASVGSSKDVKWLQSKMGERFTIKTSIVGPGSEEVPEARVLTRVVRPTGKGWEYEPDQRHAELIIKHLVLEAAHAV